MILLYLQLFIHPFHVSVSEIKYKEDKRALQISIRIFLDDLEIALRQYTANETLDIMQKESWSYVDQHVNKYVHEKFQLLNDKGPMTMSYVGAEIEDDVMWIYVEVEKVKKLKTIIVQNSLLTETYDDQENLIHFRAFNKVKSARMYKGAEQKVFDWESN